MNPKGSMYNENRAEPKTGRCGIPHRAEQEEYSLLATEKDLFHKYYLNYHKMVSFRPTCSDGPCQRQRLNL